MKLIFTLFALTIWSISVSSQGSGFIINYDPSSNTMTVTYTGCEICRMGNVNAVARCECWYSCSENVYEDLNDCLEECDENNEQGTLDHEYCVYYCQLYNNPSVVCPSEYGPEVEPVREVVAYQYRLIADFANIPFDPREDENNRVMTDIVTVFSSNVVINPWQVDSPWPEVHIGHNTCYGIQIAIAYNDGTLCGGTIWHCNIIG